MLLIAHVRALYEGAGDVLATGGIDVVDRAEGIHVPHVRDQALSRRGGSPSHQIVTLVTGVTKPTR